MIFLCTCRVYSRVLFIGVCSWCSLMRVSTDGSRFLSVKRCRFSGGNMWSLMGDVKKQRITVCLKFWIWLIHVCSEGRNSILYSGFRPLFRSLAHHLILFSFIFFKYFRRRMWERLKLKGTLNYTGNDWNIYGNHETVTWTNVMWLFQSVGRGEWRDWFARYLFLAPLHL